VPVFQKRLPKQTPVPVTGVCAFNPGAPYPLLSGSNLKQSLAVTYFHKQVKELP
jgi:hypothetical protein